MTAHRLTPRQLAAVYRWLRRDFPLAERKPLWMMLISQRHGRYEPYVFWEKGRPVAYGFLATAPGCRWALLDYLAVQPVARGSGIGTRVLQELARLCAGRWDGLLIECEAPDYAPDADAARRRIGFYRRAGAVPLGRDSLVYGVRYRLLALPARGGKAPGGDETMRAIRTLYRAMRPAGVPCLPLRFFEVEES